MNRYRIAADCEDRDDYLDYLSEIYDVPLDDVIQIADLLGENEEFDGLPNTLQDMALQQSRQRRTTAPSSECEPFVFGPAPHCPAR